MKETWGYLRETEDQAIQSGMDKDTGLHRTGLDTYLKTIFPEIEDWVHDKTTGLTVNNKKIRNRPDYRSEELKMIVEYDGLPHYTSPDVIINDRKTTQFYESQGYKVVRIPYFIQLSNAVVKKLFNVNCQTMLFNEKYPSIGLYSRNSPAYLCYEGIQRMAREFYEISSEQYEVNIEYLCSPGIIEKCSSVGIDLVRADLLINAYNLIAEKRDYK